MRVLKKIMATPVYGPIYLYTLSRFPSFFARFITSVNEKNQLKYSLKYVLRFVYLNIYCLIVDSVVITSAHSLPHSVKFYLLSVNSLLLESNVLYCFGFVFDFFYSYLLSFS